MRRLSQIAVPGLFFCPSRTTNAVNTGILIIFLAPNARFRGTSTAEPAYLLVRLSQRAAFSRPRSKVTSFNFQISKDPKPKAQNPKPKAQNPTLYIHGSQLGRYRHFLEMTWFARFARFAGFGRAESRFFTRVPSELLCSCPGPISHSQFSIKKGCPFRQPLFYFRGL